MATTKLIPGFRFHPTDVELLKYFLKRKVMGRKFLFDVIAEVDIYKYSPWDLPDKSCLRTGDLEWYFFCPREKKYASGARMNRATEAGYWKTTGKDRPVHHKNQIVGLIKTLVFHTGKAPKGERTDWVMHEFRLESNDLTDKGIPQDSYVLCKVFHKDGPGPRNGSQYGKPFNEEDWDDDGEIECVDSSGLVVPSPETMVMPCPGLMHPQAPNDKVMPSDGSHVSADGDIDSMLRFFTEDDKLATNEKVPAEDDIDKMLRSFTEDGQLATNKKVPADDDIELMLRFFTEDDDKLATNENPIEKTHDCGEEKVEEADIFKDLEDINKCTGWGRWT